MRSRTGEEAEGRGEVNPDCKIYDFDQGTDEWKDARKGVFTASSFSKILTGGGKASTQKKAWIRKVLNSAITGEDTDFWAGNAHTERGHEVEPESRDYYSFITGRPVHEVGFIRRGFMGCSPDGLTRNLSGEFENGLEVKSPAGFTQIERIESGKLPTEYKPQVHGSMVVSGLNGWDWMSYHPSYPHVLVEVERDSYTSILEEAVLEAISEMKALAEKLEIEI